MSEHAITAFTAEILNELKSAGRDFENHSIFSPSGSGMWANCSGSLIPNLFAPDKAGIDAAEGTVAHGVAEKWLKSGIRPSELVGTTERIIEGDQVFDIEITDVMLEYVQLYVDWCLCLPGTHFVETRVDFSDLTPIPRQTGTCDHAVCDRNRLVVTDLKYGKGVKVFAKNNTQALLYAYGFFRQHDHNHRFETIQIRICQPRLDHFDEWEITRSELLQWADWLKERAFAAWRRDAPRVAGEKQCMFCRVKTGCAAHVVLIERLTDGVFDNLDTPATVDEMEDVAKRLSSGCYKMVPIATHTLTTEQKAALLPYRKLVESFFEDLFNDLEKRCIAGEHVPGFKPVTSKTNRVFMNKNEAEEVLEFLGLPEEVIHPRGMLSPAQAEEELIKIGYKRKSLPILLGGVVSKPIGKPTMAPESDPRPALEHIVTNTFDDLDDI